MACYHPLKARLWVKPDGSKKVLFNRNSYLGSNWSDLDEVRLPCGKCIGCRLDRSLEWALRCEHESQLHSSNSFVTLTYSPEDLPKDGSLRKRDLQLFFKRLRKRLGNGSFRYFACGEYGGLFQRPHYHAILFGCYFQDRVLYSRENGFFLYNSPTLSDCWPYGHSVIGDVTFESCAYVARYTCKKALSDSDTKVIDDAWFEDAFDINREPEFLLMSRRPGIGSNFLKKYLTDIYSYDRVITKSGRIGRPPRFYDSYYEKAHNASYDKLGLKSLEDLKLARMEFAKAKNASITDERLAQLEQVQMYKAQKLKRELV